MTQKRRDVLFSRARAAVAQEDLVTAIASKVQPAECHHGECGGSPAEAIVEQLCKDDGFKEVIKQCLREVLDERV